MMLVTVHVVLTRCHFNAVNVILFCYSGRGGATPNALTGGRLGTGGRQPVQRRRTYAASSDAGPSAPLFDTAAPKPQNAAAITKGPADKRAEKCTEKSSLDIPAIPARDMKVIPEYASSVSQGQGRAAPTPPTPPVSKTSAPSREGSPAAPSSSAPRNHSPFTPNAEASGSLYSPDSAASTPTVASANIASAAAASTTTSIAAAQAEAALSPMAPRRSLAASLFSSAAEDEAEGETADCAQQAQVPAAPVPAQYVAACSAGAVNPPRQATEEQETHVVDIEAKEHCKKASPSASPSPAPSTATTVPISSSGNSAGSSPNTVLRNSGGKWPPVQTTHHSGGANTSNSNGADSGRTIQRVSSASSTGSFGQALKVTNVQHPAGAQLHLSGTSSGTSTSTGSAAAAGGAAASSGARSEQEQGQEQVLSHAERAQALVAAGKVSVKDRIKSYETLATSSTDTNR